MINKEYGLFFWSYVLFFILQQFLFYWEFLVANTFDFWSVLLPRQEINL